MRNSLRPNSLFPIIAVVIAALGATRAWAQSTSFTYQGELTQASVPANGVFDFEFKLFDALQPTLQIGPTVCRDNVVVNNGRFTTRLDFGPVFTGTAAALFVELSVRTDNGLDCTVPGGFATLVPRQEITLAPFATFATTSRESLLLNGQTSGSLLQRSNHTGALPGAALTGTYASAVSMVNASNAFSGTFTGSGAAITSLNAANISSGVLSIARGGTGRDTSGATTGQVLKFTGTTWAPGTDIDTDTNTTYSAGAGLLLTGTVFSVSDGGITSAMVFDNSLTAADIANNAVGSVELVSDPLSLFKVTGGAAVVIATNVGIGATPLATAKLNVGGDFNVTGAATIGGQLAAASVVIDPATRTLSVPMMAFYPFNGNTSAGDVTVDDVSVSFVAVAGSDKSVYAPVYLPHGAIVTALHAHVEDASNTDLVSSLLRRGVDGSAGSTMATVTTSGNVAGTRTFTDSVIAGATVDNNTFAYVVKVDFRPTITNPNPPILHGLRIVYTVTAPLP
ncbi:MAG: hypothetical protein ACOYN0_11585 [Phycisphaerales bacterium]